MIYPTYVVSIAIVLLLALASVYILWPLRASSSTNEYSNAGNAAPEASFTEAHDPDEALSQLELERSLGQISEEEYQSSRDMIAAQHDASHPSSLQDQVEDGLDVEAEILIARARLKAESQAAQNRGWTCASCGREMSASDKFCASCGAPQTQKSTDAVTA